MARTRATLELHGSEVLSRAIAELPLMTAEDMLASARRPLECEATNSRAEGKRTPMKSRQAKPADALMVKKSPLGAFLNKMMRTFIGRELMKQ